MLLVGGVSSSSDSYSALGMDESCAFRGYVRPRRGNSLPSLLVRMMDLPGFAILLLVDRRRVESKPKSSSNSSLSLENISLCDPFSLCGSYSWNSCPRALPLRERPFSREALLSFRSVIPSRKSSSGGSCSELLTSRLREMRLYVSNLMDLRISSYPSYYSSGRYCLIIASLGDYWRLEFLEPWLSQGVTFNDAISSDYSSIWWK